MLKNNQSRSGATVLKTTPRKVLYTIVALILIIVLIVGGIYIKNIISFENTSADMKNYLENKYNERFLVNNIRKEGSGLGVTGQTIADGRPVNNQSVIFRISDTDGKKGDNYVGALWQFRNKGKLSQIIEDSFDNGKLKNVNIHLGISGDIENLHSSLKNEDLREALKKHPGSIGITVNIEPAQGAMPKDRQDSLKKVARHLYDFGFRNVTIVYDFIANDTGHGSARCILSLDSSKSGGFAKNLEYRCTRR